MIQSQLPFKVTAAIALIVIAMIAFMHGAIDKELLLVILTPLFTFATGVITNTKVPDEKWEEMKKAEAAKPPPLGDQKV